MHKWTACWSAVCKCYTSDHLPDRHCLRKLNVIALFFPNVTTVFCFYTHVVCWVGEWVSLSRLIISPENSVRIRQLICLFLGPKHQHHAFDMLGMRLNNRLSALNLEKLSPWAWLETYKPGGTFYFYTDGSTNSQNFTCQLVTGWCLKLRVFSKISK